MTSLLGRCLLYLLLACMVGLLSSHFSPVYADDTAALSIELPPGFTVEEIGGLRFPTDMAFLPSGDLLVLEKGSGDGNNGSANIRLVQNGVVRQEPVLTMSVSVFGDAGLLGIAIDPGFDSNGYIYIWHAIGQGSPGWLGETLNRLSRFTVNSTSLIADPTSELILLDGIPHDTTHNGGGLVFDADGLLYVGIGDTNAHSKTMDISDPRGKVLRIRPTENGYTIPADNPYGDDADAMAEIYASGLRNPFKVAYRAQDDHVYIADVGSETWEEINRGLPGANYGWALREGPCPLGELMPCDSAPAEYTDPALYYVHPPGLGGSITGLAFYAGNEFPQEYAGQLFLADYNLATIQVGTLGETDFAIRPFATNVPNIVDLAYHDQKLYYLHINPGKIGVIRYTGIPNQLPIAAVEADPALGPAPLMVHFDAGASIDPDGEIVAYRWDFDDGSPPLVTDSSVTTHTYAADGTYHATLVVIDNEGGASNVLEQAIHVYSGALPTIVLSNLVEPGRALFHGGDSWEYAVQREGGVDGLDPERPYVWTVALHHNQHEHPIIADQVTDQAVLDIGRDNHDGAITIWYRFHLIMTTVSGQEIPMSADIRPAVITVGVDATPVDTTLTVNGVRHLTPYDYQAIVGTEQTVAAPSERLTAETVYSFDQWQTEVDNRSTAANLSTQSAEQAEPTFTFVVPHDVVTVRALYRFDRPAEKAHVPMIER